MWSAFTVNEYSWFEHRSACGRYYGNIVAFPGTQGGFLGLKGISRDSRGFPGTQGDFLGLKGISWDSRGFPGAQGDFLGLKGISKRTALLKDGLVKEKKLHTKVEQMS